jgi:hypothetical protein
LTYTKYSNLITTRRRNLLQCGLAYVLLNNKGAC